MVKRVNKLVSVQALQERWEPTLSSWLCVFVASESGTRCIQTSSLDDSQSSGVCRYAAELGDVVVGRVVEVRLWLLSKLAKYMPFLYALRR